MQSVVVSDYISKEMAEVDSLIDYRLHQFETNEN